VKPLRQDISQDCFSQYIGIPFKSRGRDRNGVDCWGLLRLIYREQLGIELPSYGEEYDSALDYRAVLTTIERHMHEWKPVTDARIWDAVLLRIRGLPIHLGTVIGEGRMIHVTRGISTCIEGYTSPLWRDRILGFFRHEQR